jgi:Phospholipid-translocating P-type ATPase C-terminal
MVRALAQAFVDGAICFFVPYLAASSLGAKSVSDVFSVGKTAYIAMLGVVNIELMIVARFWTWWFGVAAVISWFIGFPFFLLFSALQKTFGSVDLETYGVAQHLLATAWFWVAVITAYAVAFAGRYAERSAKLLFRPDETMVRRSAEGCCRVLAKSCNPWQWDAIVSSYKIVGICGGAPALASCTCVALL